MKSATLLLAVASLVSAGPVHRSPATSATVTSSAAISQATNIGISVSDVYPPAHTLPDTVVFPPESIVGFQQATPTGVEPFAIATGASYPTHSDIYPLNVPKIKGASTGFKMAQHWGNLSPQESVPSSTYGLDDATPKIPEHCTIDQVHLYFRHGARYPTTGSSPSTFASKMHNASLTGFTAHGALSFLNQWTFKLGAELLTPFGRKQNFDFGVLARQQYGALLNNFTEAGVLPVFRTQSQDRMVKTMLNFAAGFFGVPEFETSFNLEIGVEAAGKNTSGAPYEVCPNSNNARGSVGSAAAVLFAEPYYNKTAERLNQLVGGSLNFSATDVSAMLNLCAYETDALGYSSFCPLFTEEEFQVFEQSFDIAFAGNNGFQSPVSAAQGLGWMAEFLSRLTGTYLSPSSTSGAANLTLDSNSTTFPLTQSIYADAAHEVSIMDAMVALNLTALTGASFPPTNKVGRDHTYVASRIVPFGTQLQVQVLQCASEKQVRFMLNDAVLPLSYPGCPSNPDGLCPLSTVISALQQRVKEIDFDYACNGNYSVPAYGEIRDGMPLAV